MRAGDLQSPGAAGEHPQSPNSAPESAAASFRAAYEQARDIVLFLDRAGVIVEANDAAVDAYGYARDELLGMNIRQLRAPETRALVDAQIEEAFARGILVETLHQRRDGTTFPVEINSRAALVGGVEMLLSIVRDLTERHVMQANLLHSDRLAAVGTLVAGLAHEINNPLGYAIGNLDMLARRIPEAITSLTAAVEALGAQGGRTPDGTPPSGLRALGGRLGAIAAMLGEAQEMLAVAREGTARVRTIVDDLKRFSRPDDAMVGAVDVHEALDYALGIAESEIRARCQLVRAYGAVPPVIVNESRLGQVFLNILVNAAQATPEGAPDEHTITVRTVFDARGRVVVEIIDTGVGIPAHFVGRIFDPFVTTKAAGEGTGLGLFVSRAIVKQAGGEITVDSEVGRGTAVRVSLPPAPSYLTPPVGIPAVPRGPR